MIPEEKVHSITDIHSLFEFMSKELDWDLPSPATIDELTFEWTGTELNLSEDVACKLTSGCIRQIQPLRERQPWGIFLIDFATPHLYTTALRQVLRRLVPSRRTQKPNVPAWHCDNLLFICTTGNQEFTFAHFSGEKPERARITTFGWTPQEPVRTLCEFNLPALRYDYTWDNDKWLKEWQRAFDVEKVTKKFFDDYTSVFVELQKILNKQVKGEAGDEAAKVWAHHYALQLLNRLMFIYFIQKKKWLGENPRFIRRFWQAYHDARQPADTFFKNWISVLFFEAFNNQYQNRPEYLKRFPEDIHQALSRAPFLNGGLFTQNRFDTQYAFIVPDDFFKLLFEDYHGGPGFFERYNFTISETTPLDREVAVDPEMIGKVYESLVNITFEGVSEEDLRGGAGIFYTPRVEIDLMCRLSLVDWLTNHFGDEYKSVLYEVVFAYDLKEKEEADKRLAEEDLWSKLDKLLRSVTVLDPACGSGSFLIGMLLVLDDLLARAESQLGRKQTQFVRRKEIIANSLYGVDVMPWAVNVAELRLWLQLVIETEHQWYELKAEPMLPNLSFKLRPGDSLVQEVGGINFGLHRAHLDISSSLKGKLTQLTGEKLKFYRNDPQAKFKTEAAIKQEELNVFREILNYRVQKMEEGIKSLTRRIETPQAQAVIAGMGPKAIQAPLAVQQWKEQRSKLEEELKEVRAAKEALRTIQDVPFVWDIAFVEIFRGEKEGFDIVIGNPPYVNYKSINNPNIEAALITAESSKKYKDDLKKAIYQAFPRFFNYNPARGSAGRKIDAKSDLYIYFYFRGLDLLNEEGSFCFITSNFWLDVDYGKDLQEFLLKHSHIKMVIDNQGKRTFASADINTIIVLLSAPDDRSELGLDRTARFIMFRVPFEHILSPIIFDEIEEAKKQRSTKEYRVFSIEQENLLAEGLEISIGDDEIEAVAASTLIKASRYIGNKWGGKYLRAPDIYWTMNERSNLCRLSEIARVQTGLKESGYGEYITKAPPSESSSYAPLLKNPTAHRRINIIDADGAISIRKYPDLVRKMKTKIAPILWLAMRGDRHICYDNTRSMLPFTGNYFGIIPNKPEDTELILAICNSSFAAFIAEIYGRKGFGGGASILVKTDLMKIPFPNPKLIDNSLRHQISKSLKSLTQREINSIFAEFGFPEPNETYSNIDSDDVSLDRVIPDRRGLDRLVFEVLGLTEAEQLEVYRGVVELVKNRLAKAGSV